MGRFRHAETQKVEKPHVSKSETWGTPGTRFYPQPRPGRTTTRVESRRSQGFCEGNDATQAIGAQRRAYASLGVERGQGRAGGGLSGGRRAAGDARGAAALGRDDEDSGKRLRA